MTSAVRIVEIPLLAYWGLRAGAGRTPGKTALRLIDAGGAIAATLTYGALLGRMHRLGRAAQSLGLAAGDRAAIIAGNRLEYVEVVSGLSAIGTAVATPSPRLSTEELLEVLRDCGARVVFADSDKAEALADLSGDGAPERIIAFGAEYDELLNAASDTAFKPEELAAETDDFVIPYTSGTTGRPKGVRVSHRSRTLTFHAMGVEYGCFGPEDHFQCIAPLCHGAGLAFGLAPVYFGGTCDIFERFNPELVLAKLKSEGNTGTFMVPTHFHALFELEKKTLARHRPSALKAIISNAAPLPQVTKERIVDYFGGGLLHECYGSTEGGIVTNLRPPDQLRKERCVGRPFPNTAIRLVDDDGGEVAPGGMGELFSASPYVFSGYLDLPEETEAALDDGWVSAGDVARQDEEGYFYIVDRKKDMLISGGLNVYPREVEETLMRHAGVKEAAVIGVPDDYWGECVAAFVVRSDGDAVDEDALKAHARAQLADYKQPRIIRWIDALPRSASGKVLKSELRTRAGASGDGSP